MTKIQTVDELPLKPTENSIYAIESNGITAHTHGFFKYPCKFIPHVPRWAINKYCSGKACKIIDPFCGSGTTLVESILLGHEAYGVEIDSFGRMLAKVKTNKIDNHFEKRIILFLKKLDDIKSQEEKIIPDINNISLWFTPSAIDILGKIKYLINKQKKDKHVYDFLSVCFANIIRKASNADEQSPKPYVSKRFPKIQNDDLSNKLKQIIIKYLSKIKLSSVEFKNISQIIGNDATNFKYENKFDLAITSPPYINAFDYVRTLRLENLWLELDNESTLREVKKKHVGTESLPINEEIAHPKSFPKELSEIIKKIEIKDKKRALVVTKYFSAMSENMSTVFNHLKKGGHYVIVIGDSNIKGVPVDTHSILLKIGKNLGYKKDACFSYIIKNRYLRIPRQGRGGLIKNDWIISLSK
ncbi:MAG: DNA methyltransferase [Patescibacteria group bacterium]|nr:modification methylase [Patescibacteria group bacterium]MBU2081365.1 modification methylase [Patescibacteria group bacterium]MBU2250242.1 modification methylase [Patescibacteria group bacterium]